MRLSANREIMDAVLYSRNRMRNDGGQVRRTGRGRQRNRRRQADPHQVGRHGNSGQWTGMVNGRLYALQRRRRSIRGNPVDIAGERPGRRREDHVPEFPGSAGSATATRILKVPV